MAEIISIPGLGGIERSAGPIIAGGESALQPGGSPLTGGDTNVTPGVNLPSWSAIWNTINSRTTWIRIAEGVLGIALILVALAEMTNHSSVGGMVKTAAKAATA